MKYTYANAQGKRSIASAITFIDALDGRNPLEVNNFTEVLTKAEQLVTSEYPSTPGAMNNVRGDWYEWLLSLGAAHYAFEIETDNIVLPLPNVKSYDCGKFYLPEISSLLDDLRAKLLSAADVSLITSNPDYAVFKRPSWYKFDPRGSTASQVTQLDELYRSFDQLCEITDISAYASVKTSLRPDRRLQLSHEGSLMKALYKHLQTRLWDIELPLLKYYGITTNHTDADAKGLRTVATHSIVSVSGTPEAAVDDLFTIQSGDELRAFLKRVCHN